VASTSDTVAWLRRPDTIRERCGQVLELGVRGRLPCFRVELARLDDAAALVADVTRAAYPDLRIPVHGRMRHFDVGGVRRGAAVDAALAGLPAAERARAKLDLIVVSVLLDAGAGAAWRYHERETGGTYARSEGLAVASLRMFLAGAFSSDPARPLQADAAGLAAVTPASLARGFQVGPENPLVGVEGRVALLAGLARALPRPGALYDDLVQRAVAGRLTARDVLAVVLERLGGIWPGRVELCGVNLGDVWPCAALAPADAPLAERLVPFHKLSQWLSYSMIEVLEEAGLPVDGLDDLTGLAEYRNGGLFWDSGVITPRDPAVSAPGAPRPRPGDEIVVEWRALTVALLDAIAPRVRERLGPAAASLPLANILEGGTWAAGRKLAAEKRPGATPPLEIDSDGTVF
jgi:hypothetical protein